MVREVQPADRRGRQSVPPLFRAISIATDAGGKDTGGAPTLIKNGKIVVYGLTKSGKKKRKTRAIQNAEEASTVMHRVDAWRMIQRRSAELGMKVKIGCHTFRATGITAYLEAGGTLENAQVMAAHESPRTTKLCDRTGDEITLDEVERITI